MGKSTKVLCYSAGMDSYCLDEIYDYDEYVFFDVDTKESGYEREMIESQIPEAHIHELNLEQFAMDNHVVPLRNAIFAILAANYGSEIHLGGTYGDRFNVLDGDEVVADMVSSMLNYFNGVGRGVDAFPHDTDKFSVEYPFAHLTKGEILQKTLISRFVEVDEIMSNSKTCHYGDDENGCGKCEDCFRRAGAISYVSDSRDRVDKLFDDHFRCNPFNVALNRSDKSETVSKEFDKLLRRDREADQVVEQLDWYGDES